MTKQRTVKNARQGVFFKEPIDVEILDETGMSPHERDELLSEILGSQLRRRSMSRYAPKPAWTNLL